MIPQVKAAEVAAWLKDGNRDSPLLVDVREPWEYAICHIDGSRLIPLQTLPTRLSDLPKDRDLVLVCRSGHRSQTAAEWLARNGFPRVHNLSGGVRAWSSDVDPTMPKY